MTKIATAPLAANADDVTALEFAKFVNTHTNDYIRLADQKAAILITLLSANVLVLVQHAGMYIREGHTAWRLGLVIVACLYAVSSLAVAVNIIRPRLFRNAAHGHVFWEDITAVDKVAYARSLRTLSADDMLQELGQHNHNLSRTAMRKFRWLRYAFAMALTSIVLSAVVILATSR